jgi:hypothetical protein
MDIDPIIDADMAEGERLPTLGPGYFAAQRFAASFVEGLEAEHFKPIAEKAAKEIADAIFTRIDEAFLYGLESNVQTHIWQQVDQIVRGLLAGTPWMIERFALGSRYDCDKVRAAIAQHIPKALQDARVADLEAEVASLKQSLEWARR